MIPDLIDRYTIKWSYRGYFSLEYGTLKKKQSHPADQIAWVLRYRSRRVVVMRKSERYLLAADDVSLLAKALHTNRRSRVSSTAALPTYVMGAHTQPACAGSELGRTPFGVRYA